MDGNTTTPKTHLTLGDLDVATPILLMHPPTYFRIEEPDENEFSKAAHAECVADPAGFAAKAMAQWAPLKDIYNALGAQTPMLEPAPEKPNGIYTADPSNSLRRADGSLAVIFSRFTNAPRQAEVEAQMKLLLGTADLEKDTFVSSVFKTEGTGDNVYDPFRDMYWSGYSPQDANSMDPAVGRSDKNAHAFLKDVTGVEVMSLEVKAPFYHIDTAVAPLPGGHVMVYKGGMTAQAYDTMIENAFTRFGLDPKEYVIDVSKDDAEKFACNVRNIPVKADKAAACGTLFTAFPENYTQGHAVVLPECSQNLQDRIAAKGYGVVAVPMSQLIKAGGAGHCATNNINETRVAGGYAKKLGFQDKMQP